jgi:uncharacterized protein with HEPN domain
VSTRSWFMRIEDILDAIDSILEYTSYMDQSSWEKDRKTIDAVIRNFEIIGEAATHVPEDVQNNYREVPWSQMKGIRNLLIHEYFGVDVDVVWETIQKDIEPLKKSLKKIKE